MTACTIHCRLEQQLSGKQVHNASTAACASNTAREEQTCVIKPCVTQHGRMQPETHLYTRP